MEHIRVVPFSQNNVAKGDTYIIWSESHRIYLSCKVGLVDVRGFYYDNPPVYAKFSEARGMIFKPSGDDKTLELISNHPISLSNSHNRSTKKSK